MKRTRILFVLTMLVGLLGSFVLAELVLRGVDYKIVTYWHIFTQTLEEPNTNQPDAVLGWRPKPGSYTIPAYSSDTEDIRLEIWPDGARATSEERKRRDNRIVAVGGSLVQGWAISDDETFLWKLQEADPDSEFVNLGVVGYSTYQSLLMLEDYLESTGARPSLILYGMIDHHPLRNVADLDWLLTLSLASRRGHVYLPYCLRGKNDELECHPPQPYPRWPLDRTLLFVNLVKDAYIRYEFRDRKDDRHFVTEELLRKMDRLARDHGARFVTVLFYGSSLRDDYREFFESSELNVIDCLDERVHSREMKVRGEGHPNATMNAVWADCLGNRIQDYWAIPPSGAPYRR